MSYIYIKTESRLWTVGFYGPNGEFTPESDHSSTEEGAARVHYLNGGNDRVGTGQCVVKTWRGGEELARINMPKGRRVFIDVAIDDISIDGNVVTLDLALEPGSIISHHPSDNVSILEANSPMGGDGGYEFLYRKKDKAPS